jgi:hypothetical protein
MFIPDPDFLLTRIPDPKKRDEVENKLVVLQFFVAINSTKLNKFFFIKQIQTKN